MLTTVRAARKKPGRRSPTDARRQAISRKSSRMVRPASSPWVAQIKTLQEGFALNQLELATQLLRCAPRSLLLWNQGAVPNESVLIRLEELSRLYKALAELMPENEVGPWMKRTNDYLEPLTPLEVINRGQIDRLWHIIHNVGTGMPT